jgi:hypothetical protein
MESLIIKSVDYIIANGFMAAVPIVTMLLVAGAWKYRLKPVYLNTKSTNSTVSKIVTSIGTMAGKSKDGHQKIIEEIQTTSSAIKGTLEQMEKDNLAASIKNEMKLDELLRTSRSGRGL